MTDCYKKLTEQLDKAAEKYGDYKKKKSDFSNKELFYIEFVYRYIGEPEDEDWIPYLNENGIYIEAKFDPLCNIEDVYNGQAIYRIYNGSCAAFFSFDFLLSMDDAPRLTSFNQVIPKEKTVIVYEGICY